MPTVLQLRRGTTAQNNAFTGSAGELSFNTSTGAIRMHDGSTAGGLEALATDGSNIASTFAASTITASSLDISGSIDVDGTCEADAYTVNGTSLAEYISDTAGAMWGSNSESNITVTYQDSDNTLDISLNNTAVTAGSYGSSSAIPTFTVDAQGRLTAAGTVAVSSDLPIAGDSGTGTISLLSETFTIAGGDDITTSMSGNTLTIALDTNIDANVTGNVTGNLTGNADTATQLYINNDDTGDTNCPILFTQDSTAGNKSVYEDSSFYFDNTNNRVYATQFNGVATSAKYADLAEKYMPDAEYTAGTVLQFGGEQEVTAADEYATRRVAGVVSMHPGFMMNESLEGGVYIALTGRVPCRATGIVNPGDLMVASNTAGVAAAWNDPLRDPPAGSIIGKAIKGKALAGEEVIEVVVGVR